MVANKSQLQFDKAKYEREYLKQWTESGVDALIMPVTPWVGYPPWTWIKSQQYVGYTSVWNFVNYAALAMPVATVSAAQDQVDEEWRRHVPRNPSDEFNHQQCKSLMHWFAGPRGHILILSIDDVEAVEGLPVGVQVVGGKFGEEKSIAVAKIIESLLK